MNNKPWYSDRFAPYVVGTKETSQGTVFAFNLNIKFPPDLTGPINGPLSEALNKKKAKYSEKFVNNLILDLEEESNSYSYNNLAKDRVEGYIREYVTYLWFEVATIYELPAVKNQHFTPDSYSQWFADCIDPNKKSKNRLTVLNNNKIALDTSSGILSSYNVQINGNLLPLYEQQIEGFLSKNEGDYSKVVMQFLNKNNANSYSNTIEAEVLNSLNLTFNRIVMSVFIALLNSRHPDSIKRFYENSIKHNLHNPESALISSVVGIATDVYMSEWEITYSNNIYFLDNPVLVEKQSQVFNTRWHFPLNNNLLLTCNLKNKGTNKCPLTKKATTDIISSYLDLSRKKILNGSSIGFGSPYHTPFEMFAVNLKSKNIDKFLVPAKNWLEYPNCIEFKI